jgi:menaquinone-dependent protoporphyrinogen IX oxidase
MNKHRRRKFEKKYASLIKKTRMKREVKKEKLFRAELLAQIKEAEQFNAETYVRKMLDTIDRKPQRESLWERRERIMSLKRIHRTNVDLIRPKFDDPVE